MTRLLMVGVVLAASWAHAEDPKQKAAREELERQLNQMVGKQPTRVRIEFEPLDEPNYKLEEVGFELDGSGVSSPSLDKLMQEGTQLVWSGDVTPGKHVVTAHLVYSSTVSPLIVDEGGHRWKIGGNVSFEVNSGIEVQVKVVPKRDGANKDIAKRFSLRLPAVPVMLAKLDDGKMPEPVKKPEIPDAGVAVVAAVDPKKAAEEEKKRKAEEAAEAKRVAAEEKKRKAEEAAEAKRLAAEEKKRKAEEAAEAKRLAAEEKKRKAEEAKEAKRLAAEEKKRKAEEAAEAKRLAAEEAKQAKLAPPLVDAGVAVAAVEPVVDAGPPVAEVVDAGVPAVIAAAVVDAGQPEAVKPPPAVAEEGPPWLIIGGVGGAIALVLLIVIARRRSRPPSID